MARFDCATWKPVANHGGPMSAQYGLLLHHAVADGSLHDFFNNPDSEVSAHFWVSRTGTVEQYVDSETVAWHAMQMNDTYCGVETEGCTAAYGYAEPMTDAMINGLASIYQEGHDRHGWPNALADADGQKGFGYHRMAVATACPCDVRLSRRPQILELAFGKGTTPPVPPSTTPPGTVTAPPFPYPADNYLGQPAADPKCHSGFYGGPDSQNVAAWQTRMLARGWAGIGAVDGKFGPNCTTVATQFQTEAVAEGYDTGGVDGLVGPKTWGLSWTKPVT
jgi:hypothetical protein